jgi:hypothetical protein
MFYIESKSRKLNMKACSCLHNRILDLNLSFSCAVFEIVMTVLIELQLCKLVQKRLQISRLCNNREFSERLYNFYCSRKTSFPEDRIELSENERRRRET